MREKITALTPQQETDLIEFRERYLAKGLRCGHDKQCEETAALAVAAAYAEIGKPPPTEIVWAPSPAAAIKLLKERTGVNHANEWWNYGQCESYWLAWARFAQHIGVTLDTKSVRQLDVMERLAESCFAVWSWENLTVLSEHPKSISFDSAGRLHRTDGLALEFRDGNGVYAVHGVRLSTSLGAAMATGTLTAPAIRDQPNAEIRRVLIKLYNNGDTGRYLRDVGAKVVHEDTDPLGNPRRLLLLNQTDDEVFLAIEVTNSTPEPDGTRKVYTFRCHPELRPLPIAGLRSKLGEPQAMTCQNAIASTYGLTGEQYKLSVET